MPRFDSPPNSLRVPDGYMYFEQAFHQIGEHKYTEWDRERVLQHDCIEKSEGPTRDMVLFAQTIVREIKGIELSLEEAAKHLRPEVLKEHAEDVQEDNHWIQIYKAVLECMLDYCRTGLTAYGYTAQGAIKALESNSWNGIFAGRAAQLGSCYVQDGLIVAAPSKQLRQSARLQGTKIPQHCYLLIKTADLEKRLYKGQSPEKNAKRKAEEVFSQFLDEIVSENLENRIVKTAYLAEFKRIHPSHAKNLSGNAADAIRKVILEKHGASAWMKGSRPKKAN